MPLKANDVLASRAYVDANAGTFMYKTHHVMPAGSSSGGTMASIIPQQNERDKYDPSSVSVEVWVLDETVGSPHNGQMVPGHTALSIGFNMISGAVTVINTHSAALTVLLRISYRKKGSTSGG